MFPHLVALMNGYNLSADDMCEVIGKNRRSFLHKMQDGSFTPGECRKLCKFFRKTFDYLFATKAELREEKQSAARKERTGAKKVKNR